MQYRTGTKRPRKPLSEEGKPGRYDERNTVNDLTGKEWLLLSRSFWVSEAAQEDYDGYKHPAPFLVGDVQRLISLFTKRNMTILDPFAGVGSAIVAAAKLGRKGIGIELSKKYHTLSKDRLSGFKGWQMLLGDALQLVDTIGKIDYIVTSPPYHNILRNNGKGIRHANGKAYRRGARDGVEFYSNHANDLGNFDCYDDFLISQYTIMRKAFQCLRFGRYCTMIISDFTVERTETFVQGDVVRLMEAAGFDFVGTTVLLQTVKPLFPFGYPYAYKINHHHHNMINFRKPAEPGERKRTVVRFGETIGVARAP
jgi:DNA modification methylase